MFKDINTDKGETSKYICQRLLRILTNMKVEVADIYVDINLEYEWTVYPVGRGTISIHLANKANLLPLIAKILKYPMTLQETEDISGGFRETLEAKDWEFSINLYDFPEESKLQRMLLSCDAVSSNSCYHYTTMEDEELWANA